MAIESGKSYAVEVLVENAHDPGNIVCRLGGARFTVGAADLEAGVNGVEAAFVVLLDSETARLRNKPSRRVPDSERAQAGG